LKTKRIILILFFPLFAIGIKGQVNHVLNYSFELYSNCAGLIGNCTGSAVPNWYCPTNPPIDWFSYPCGGSLSTIGVPQNFAGYQFARTGEAYAGVEFSETGPTRTYITGTFPDSLINTKKYCITFYVSLGDSTWWAISGIGAYLSIDSICGGNNFDILRYVPQIENPINKILTNKIDWVSISGEYQANGGEKFITIGDFYSDTLSKATYVGNGGTTTGWQSEVQTYYYIDDVYVRELTIAVAGRNDTICAGDSLAIGNDNVTAGVSFSWQPTAGLSNPNTPQPKASPSVTTTYTLTVTNDSILAVNNSGQACNCADSITKDSVTVTVKTCAGINKLNSSSFFDVFPNPNNGVFTFMYKMENASNCNASIYNQIGMKVAEYLLTSPVGSMQINDPNLSQGLYIYKVYSGPEVLKVGKIIIIR
jgi:hypothetical protein